MKSVFILVIALALLVLGTGIATRRQAAAFPVPSPLLVDPVQQLEAQVARSITISSARISPARRAVYVGLIARTAMETFSTQEQRRYWVALLGVESRYESSARSSTGAVGLGQLIPSYRNDFGKSCGLTAVDVSDLQDDAVNLRLSSCYFKRLIVENSGNIPLAMIAYTAGPFSHDYQAAKKGGAISASSTTYVTRIAIKKARMEHR